MHRIQSAPQKTDKKAPLLKGQALSMSNCKFLFKEKPASKSFSAQSHYDYQIRAPKLKKSSFTTPPTTNLYRPNNKDKEFDEQIKDVDIAVFSKT